MNLFTSDLLPDKKRRKSGIQWINLPQLENIIRALTPPIITQQGHFIVLSSSFNSTNPAIVIGHFSTSTLLLITILVITPTAPRSKNPSLHHHPICARKTILSGWQFVFYPFFQWENGPHNWIHLTVLSSSLWSRQSFPNSIPSQPTMTMK